MKDKVERWYVTCGWQFHRQNTHFWKC